MIAVMRSLGAAGATVHAVSASHDALGFHSGYARHKVHCPPVFHPDFLPWLARYIHEHDIRVIMPTESLVLALLPRLDQFSSWLPISLEPARLRLAFSKAGLQQFFEKKGITQAAPKFFVCTEDNYPALTMECRHFDFPVFVKVDAVDALPASSPTAHVRSVASLADLQRCVGNLLKDFSRVLVQSFVPGKGAGVNCLRWDGELTSLTNLCVHESPHTGGLSSLRRVWRHNSMEADAEMRLQALDWRGVAMLEYRVDPVSGDFNFIELNARFWAALHLCLFAGADFPVFLVQRHLGQNTRPSQNWQSVRACYDVPGEVAYATSLLKDPAVPILKKLGALFALPGAYLDPRIRLDLYYPGDEKLYFINLMKFFGMSRWLARNDIQSWAGTE